MDKHPPSSIRRYLPAAAIAILLFIPIFMLTYFGDQHSGWDISIFPKWLEALLAATIFSLPVGILVAFITWYAEGKERRIQEMLNSK